MAPGRPQPDVYLLGSGIYSFLDLTLWTQHVLTSLCRTVYLLHDLPSLERYVRQLAPRVENLMPLYYRDGRDRSDIYDDVVRHVVDTPPGSRPAALLLHGHPLVYSTISQRLAAACARLGLSLEVAPAVSSLDRIFVDLRLDVGEDGLQVLDSAALLAGRVAPHPGVGCLVFQVGALVPEATRAATPAPAQVARLRDALLRSYPASHMVKLIESAVEVGFSSRVTEIELGRLEEASEGFTYNASLYVPPIPPA